MGDGIANNSNLTLSTHITPLDYKLKCVKNLQQPVIVQTSVITV